LLFNCNYAFSDTIPDRAEIEGALRHEGFENLQVLLQDDTLWVTAENRRYRYDPKGYARLIDIVEPHIDHGITLAVAVLKRGVPLAWVAVRHDSVQVSGDTTRVIPAGFRTISSGLRVPGYVARASRSVLLNPVWNKFDLVVYPQVKLQLGNFDDPFQSQFNIVPSLEVSFVRGMHVMAQVIIPLQNDLEPNGNSVRPGILSISQLMKLPLGIYGLASAGYFTRNRYGLNAELRRFFVNGKWYAGFTGGMTGYAAFVDRSWEYGDIDLFTWFADAGFRWSRYDLTLQAGFGRFTDGNNGWRADIFRQFGEVTIGVFALQTAGFSNGGFYFRVPLPPRKYSTKGFARIRPAPDFPYEYRARGLSDAGRMFSTGQSLENLFHNISPDFLKSQIEREWHLNKEKSEKK
jgi:hypothetical protein